MYHGTQESGPKQEKILVPELTALAPIVSDTVDANLKHLCSRPGITGSPAGLGHSGGECGGGFGSGAPPVEETVINNYYDDPPFARGAGYVLLLNAFV